MILPEKSKASSREALQVRNKFLMVALLTIICFGSFVMGYELVAVSMLEKEIQLHNNLSSDSLHYYLTLVTITLPLGAILGCLLTKHLEERGENRLMMISDVVVILSSLLMVTSLDITTLSAGRFLMGVSCGISSSIVPPYLISVSPLEWKGMIGSLHQLFVTIGVGFSFYLGQRMEELSVFSISNWRSYLLLPILYSSFRLTILSIFKFDNLETYYEANNTGKLNEFMRLFYNRVDVKELVRIKKFSKQNATEEAGREDARIWGMHPKVLNVSVFLLVLNQLSGINIVLSYAKQLFMKISYYNEQLANFYLLILAVVQILATLAGGWLINRFGRKRMLVAGGQLVTVALFAVFIVYSFSPKSMHLLVLLIVLFTLGYSATIGVIPLIYLGELMQNLSQVNIIYWFFALVGMLSSDIMLAQMGVGKSFFLYGLISYICVYLLSGEMVESHNKTRKELNSEYLYENKEEGALREYKRMEIGSAEGNSLIDAVET